MTTLLTSCASGKVEYVDKPIVPEVFFPDFPEIGETERNDNGTVSVSEDWIVRIAEFKIRYKETEKSYNELKVLYSRE